MNVISNEMIFYTGLIIVGVAVLLGIAYSVIYCFEKRSLNAKFDAEYGKIPKK